MPKDPAKGVDDRMGAHMIVHLQKLVGIKVTVVEARERWKKMTPMERTQTVQMYDLYLDESDD